MVLTDIAVAHGGGSSRCLRRSSPCPTLHIILPEPAPPTAAAEDARRPGRMAAGRGAEQQPVLAVWEDLHWADPSTLEFLSLVLDQVPTARMLTLLTCRPEFLLPGPAART